MHSRDSAQKGKFSFTVLPTTLGQMVRCPTRSWLESCHIRARGEVKQQHGRRCTLLYAANSRLSVHTGRCRNVDTSRAAGTKIMHVGAAVRSSEAHWVLCSTNSPSQLRSWQTQIVWICQVVGLLRTRENHPVRDIEGFFCQSRSLTGRIRKLGSCEVRFPAGRIPP